MYKTCKLYLYHCHEVCKFCSYKLVLRTQNWYPFLDRGINLPCVILKYTKFANFIGSYLAHFTTFRSPPCISTNFGMLFNAGIMNCAISRFLKILSIMQSVHLQTTNYLTRGNVVSCLPVQFCPTYRPNDIQCFRTKFFPVLHKTADDIQRYISPVTK